MSFPLGAFGGSAHGDILNASPSTRDEKLRLFEEIKGRGRAAIQCKAYPDADALYGKGIEVLSSDEEAHRKELAILYGNRSLARLQMNKTSDAASDGRMATTYDDTYVKGFWRLGQALGGMDQWTDALEAYEKALVLEGGEEKCKNGPLKKEIQKARRKIAELKTKEENEANNIDKEEKSEPAPPSLPPKSTNRESKRNKQIDQSEASEFSKSDHVRGYKLVGDKKTSYFHHEQTDEEKRLIGDIAPKRISPLSEPNDGKPADAEKGTSAWNKAGTWEERDVTAWSVQTLRSSLQSAKFVLPDGSADAGAICSVQSIDGFDSGHASFAVVRGKKKYIYEFSITVHWTMELTNGDSLSGTMKFPDIDGTCQIGEGYDVTHFTVSSEKSQTTHGGAVYLAQRFIRDDGLRAQLNQKIDEWVLLFKATY